MLLILLKIRNIWQDEFGMATKFLGKWRLWSEKWSLGAADTLFLALQQRFLPAVYLMNLV
jgi:hypothetical protein